MPPLLLTPDRPGRCSPRTVSCETACRRTVHVNPVRAWSGRWHRDGIDWCRLGGAFHAERYVRRFGAIASLPKPAAIRVDVALFGSASPDAAFVDDSGSTLHVKLWMRRAAHHARSTPVALGARRTDCGRRCRGSGDVSGSSSPSPLLFPVKHGPTAPSESAGHDLMREGAAGHLAVRSTEQCCQH